MTSLKELKEIYQTINEIIKGGISERNAFFSIKYLVFFCFFFMFSEFSIDLMLPHRIVIYKIYSRRWDY